MAACRAEIDAIAANPADGLRPPKRARSLPKALGIDQAAALLDVALDRAVAQVSAMDVDARLEARYQKFRAIGQIGIESPAAS